MTCLRSLPVRNWWTLRVKVLTDPRVLPHVALSQRLAGSAVSSIVRPLISCLANCLVRCMALGLLMAFGIGCPLAAPHLAQAEEWQASLYNEGLPTHLVAVDKKRQTFMFFEKKSPLKLKYTYPCTTGQLPGDKQALNDLRTPEGIYFAGGQFARAAAALSLCASSPCPPVAHARTAWACVPSARYPGDRRTGGTARRADLWRACRAGSSVALA